MLFVYLALRCFVPRGEGQLALMPTVLFYAFVLDANSVHYSSETVPVLLVCAAAWLLCRGWMSGEGLAARVLSLFVAFLSGCLPFAKLQVTPLAIYLAATELGLIVFLHRKACVPKLGLMCLGGILFPAVLLGVVAACGAAGDFWVSYVLGPAGYAQETFTVRVRTALVPLFLRPRVSAVFLLTQRFAESSCSRSGVMSGRRDCRPNFWCHWQRSPHLGWLRFSAWWRQANRIRIICPLLIPAQGIFFGVALAFGKSLLLAPEEDHPEMFPRPDSLPGFRTVCGDGFCLQMTKA